MLADTTEIMQKIQSENVFIWSGVRQTAGHYALCHDIHLFILCVSLGRYITFIMNPLLYPSVIKHGKQLDFHTFSDSAASRTFGFPPIRSGLFPGISDSIQRSYTLLQGPALEPLTFSMMGNLQQVLRRCFLPSEESGSDGDWQEAELYEFCKCVMFQTTFNTLYGHSSNLRLDQLREDFEKFDAFFPLLMARVPIALLGKTKEIREKLIRFFYPQRMAEWRAPCEFIQTRTDLFQKYDTLQDKDKAGDSPTCTHTNIPTHTHTENRKSFLQGPHNMTVKCVGWGVNW